jgi:3-hydroxyacyl-[acyl-carrier-protein] dehydratase
MWVDAITSFEPNKRLVAVKNVSLAEEHLHDHFAADGDDPAMPLMPNSLIIEGMAQTAGILVGSVNAFREKVILGKIVRARIDRDVVPGRTIRYDAMIERMDGAGASTTGKIEMIDHAVGTWEAMGEIDLIFSHIDNNLAGTEFPEHNFVFGENFRTLLRSAGLESVCD